MTEELKSCPFCGADEPYKADTGVHWIRCGACTAEGAPFDTEEEAATFWNTRAAVVPAQGATTKPIRSLINEIHGVWDAFEIGLRQEISNTNYAVVKQKLAEAELALQTLSALLAEGNPDNACEWRDAILSKCKASDGFDRLQWAGDKDGWGFVHYFIGHLETRALEAEKELARLRSPAVKADEDPTQTVLDAIHSSDYDCIGEDGDQSGTHAGYRHKGNRLSQPGMGWQPIEMAPRDGTKILLRFDPPFYDTMETGIAVGCANADGTWWLSCIWAGSSPHRQPIAWASIPSTDGERA